MVGGFCAWLRMLPKLWVWQCKNGHGPKFSRMRFARISSSVPHLFFTRLATMLPPKEGQKYLYWCSYGNGHPAVLVIDMEHVYIFVIEILAQLLRSTCIITTITINFSEIN